MLRAAGDKLRGVALSILQSPAAIGFQLAVLALVLAAWSWQDFRATRAEAHEQLQAAAQLTAGHTARSLATIQFVLDSAADLVDRVGLEGLSDQATWERLRRLGEHLPPSAALFVYDPSGRNVASSATARPPPVSVADRTYFRALAEGSPGLQIGPALRGRTVHGTFFPVARALRGPQGELRAVLQVGVETGYLSEFARALALPPGAEIAVYDGASGAALARAPGLAAEGERMPGVEVILPALAESAPGWEGEVGKGEGQRYTVARTISPGGHRLVATAAALRAPMLRAPLRRAGLRMALFAVLAVTLSTAAWLATRRRAAEVALQGQRQRVSLALEGADLAAWDWNLTTDEVVFSERWARMRDQAPEEIEPHVRSFLLGVHPDDLAGVQAVLDQYLAGQRERYEAEFRVRKKGGEWLWILDRGRVLERDAGGRPTRMVGTELDITERHLAEERLRESDRRKNEFLAMLSHELRNPLTPIGNAAHLLRLLAPRTPALQGPLDIIERQLKALVRLVDDLLDVARVSRGKIRLVSTPLDLAEVLRQAVETSRPQIDARSHRLEVVLPLGPVPAVGDGVRLAQAVSNLLNNAAKFTDPGGRIALTLERAGEGAAAEAVIRVEDDGRGLTPRALESVFELFYQADATLARTEGGLGIGLSLVRSLVELHGGRVEAHSPGPGRGSTFVVRLPCAEAGQEARAEDPGAGEERPGAKAGGG